jgi:hypothetical protein
VELIQDDERCPARALGRLFQAGQSGFQQQAFVGPVLLHFSCHLPCGGNEGLLPRLVDDDLQTGRVEHPTRLLNLASIGFNERLADGRQQANGKDRRHGQVAGDVKVYGHQGRMAFVEVIGESPGEHGLANTSLPDQDQVHAFALLDQLGVAVQYRQKLVPVGKEGAFVFSE